MVESKNGVRDHKCAFCRQEPTNSIKSLKRLMKKNDPEAFIHMAMEYKSGERTLQSDTKALEMYIRNGVQDHEDHKYTTTSIEL